MRCLWLAVALKRDNEKDPRVFTVDRQALGDYFAGKDTDRAAAVAALKNWIETTYPLARHFTGTILDALKIQTGHRPADAGRCAHCGHRSAEHRAGDLAGAL